MFFYDRTNVTFNTGHCLIELNLTILNFHFAIKTVSKLHLNIRLPLLSSEKTRTSSNLENVTCNHIRLYAIIYNERNGHIISNQYKAVSVLYITLNATIYLKVSLNTITLTLTQMEEDAFVLYRQQWSRKQYT